MSTRHRIDWAAAKVVFVSDPRRSFLKISRQFSVSTVSVRKHAKREGWEAEAARFDRDTAERALAAQVKTRDEHITRALRVRDQAFANALDALLDRSLEVKLSDLPAIGRYAELLTGEATDRVEIREVREFVVAFIRYTGSFVPKERREEFLAGAAELMSGLERGEGEAA